MIHSSSSATNSNSSATATSLLIPARSDVDETVIRPEYVVAIHDYTPQPGDATHLAFRAGQVIRVHNRDASGWWDGELETRRGWLPSNYVNPGLVLMTEEEDPVESCSGFPYTPPIMAPLLHNLSILQHHVRWNRLAHFQPSTACIISSVRRILALTGTLRRNAPLLQNSPALSDERRRVLTVLASLLAQAKRASEGDLGIDGGNMLRLGDQVVSQVWAFLVVAVECGVVLPQDLDASVTVTMASGNPQGVSSDQDEYMLRERTQKRVSISSVLSSPSVSSQHSTLFSPLPFPLGPSSAAQVLEALRYTHDDFLSAIAAFIGHIHSYSRSSHASSILVLYDLVKEMVAMACKLLTIVKAVMQCPEVPAPHLDNLGQAKKELYNVTSSLVELIRLLTVSRPSLSEYEEKEVLLRSSTTAVEAGAACVAAVKACLAGSISNKSLVVNLPSVQPITPVASSTSDPAPVAAACNSHFSGIGVEDYTILTPSQTVLASSDSNKKSPVNQSDETPAPSQDSVKVIQTMVVRLPLTLSQQIRMPGRLGQLMHLWSPKFSSPQANTSRHGALRALMKFLVNSMLVHFFLCSPSNWKWTSEGVNFRISNRNSSSTDVIDGIWNRLSVTSRETFETAQEPPPELLLALGLHLTPISCQTSLPTSDELSLDTDSPVSGAKAVFREGPSHAQRSMDSENTANSNLHSPQYDISFIRDATNVSIMNSQINFTTNIMELVDDVRVGLYTRCDPDALYNSYERQRTINQQMKALRAWGSQLLITSTSNVGEYPLSVPSIKTRDLEQVVKDVFTWLYSVSSPHSIMCLYDEDEGHEGNLRTSLVGQCLANFLDDAGTAGTGDPSSIIIPTIACEITRRIPEVKRPIALTAANDPWIFDLSLDEQLKSLVVEPLRAAANAVKGNSHKFPQLFLIHGLEDCNDEDFQELFFGAFGKSLIQLQQCIPQKLMLLRKHTAHLKKCFSKPKMQEVVRHRLLPVSQDD